MGDVMKQPDTSEHPTAALRRMHWWRMALSGLMILIAGITLGAAGTIMVIRPARQTYRPPLPTDMAIHSQMRRMERFLNLTDEQDALIETILREYFQALEQLREEARPLIEALLEDMKADVDAVLTREQRETWQDVTSEELDRAFRRGMPRDRDRRGGPGRGGRGDGDRGEFRGGERPGFWPGGRMDFNDIRGPGQRRFTPPDANDFRRYQDQFADPNSPFRRQMRPGRQARDGNRVEVAEPNAPNEPFVPE